MSETIMIPDQPNQENLLHIAASGSELAESTQEKAQLHLVPCDLDDNKLFNARLGATTAVKESFQKLWAPMEADKRYSLEETVRHDAIFTFLNVLEMVDDTPKQREAFDEYIASVDTISETLDRDNLMDLLDKYEEHPTLKMLDTLQAITPADRSRETIVQMRRALLILLDAHNL